MKEKLRVSLRILVCVIALNICFALQGDEMPNGCKGPTLCYNSPGYDGDGFLLGMGFMYQQARVSSTGYAHTNTSTTTWAPPQSGQVLRPKFETDWGIVATAGYYFKHDHWVTKMNFNYIKASTTDCNLCNCNDDVYFVPDCVWCHDLIPPQPNHLDPAYTSDEPFVNMYVKYYMLEKILSRGAYFSNSMSFEPSFGLKTVWLEFYEKACFINVYAYQNCCNRTSNSQLDTAYSAKITRIAKSEFWGFGPKIGLDTTWNLFRANQNCPTMFNLYADFDAALLIGRTTSSDTLDLNSEPTINISNDYSVMSPALRVVIGLNFERNFNDDKLHLSTKLGWDNCIYFNQFTTNCMSGICSLKTNENNTFSLSGFIVSVTLSF